MANGSQLHRRHSRSPWYSPQSTRRRPPGPSSRSFDPVTVSAPPRKVSTTGSPIAPASRLTHRTRLQAHPSHPPPGSPIAPASRDDDVAHPSMTWWSTHCSSRGTRRRSSTPQQPTARTSAVHHGVVSPARLAATQKTAAATSPTSAASTATVSHHASRRNRPTVATRNPAMAARASTRVTAHSVPSVDTPRLAKAGGDPQERGAEQEQRHSPDVADGDHVVRSVLPSLRLLGSAPGRRSRHEHSGTLVSIRGEVGERVRRL